MNVRDRLVEVHDEIVRGVYTRVVPYRAGARIAIGAFADVTIAVDEIL